MPQRFTCVIILLALWQTAWSQMPVVTVFAGNGGAGFSGDGGAATQATFNHPMGVAVDKRGNVYVADSLNHRIRKIDAKGVITTIAGSGLPGGAGHFWGDGGAALKAALNTPSSVAVDDRGNVYIADSLNHRIRKIDLKGIITTVAGNGERGDEGDTSDALRAQLNTPTDVVADSKGNLLIADSQSDRIRRVNRRGNITSLVGRGRRAFAGDGGSGDRALLNLPHGIGLDDKDNVYIADTGNHRVRKMDIHAVVRVRSNSTRKTGVIATVAGNGRAGSGGDGDSARQASLNKPQDVAADDKGNLYIADTANRCVRKVNAQGVISTLIGSDTLLEPTRLTLDPEGNLYVADCRGGRIYKVVLRTE
jgi:sugar lactone lactonase YvrE